MPLGEFFMNLSTLSILLFAAGILLLVAEMFHPGFGVAGGLGIVCLIVDVIITAKTWQQGLVLTAVILVIVAAFLIACIVLAQKGKLSGKVVLMDATDRSSGYTAAAEETQTPDLLGCIGTAVTVLRPAGIADFDGKRMDVVTRGDFIQPGTLVEVSALEGNRIVVRPAAVPATV